MFAQAPKNPGFAHLLQKMAWCLQPNKVETTGGYSHCFPSKLDKGHSKMELGKEWPFSVKSLYKQMCNSEINYPSQRIWKAKIPPKVKVFMWLIDQNAILTKYSLSKRNWHGDLRCKLCTKHETINHLFFYCTMDKYVWSLVALVIGAPCRPCYFAQFWIGVHTYVPGRGKTYMVGLTVICWAL